jgi:soluble lytic murein transglycosylase-like protein
MQLMPETAADMGVENPYCPYQNIEGGCRYLRMMWDRFKPRWKWALAAYNAGPTRVMEAGGIPKIPETVRYVKKVLATKRILGEGMIT